MSTSNALAYQADWKWKDEKVLSHCPWLLKWFEPPVETWKSWRKSWENSRNFLRSSYDRIVDRCKHEWDFHLREKEWDCQFQTLAYLAECKSKGEKVFSFRPWLLKWFEPPVETWKKLTKKLRRFSKLLTIILRSNCGPVQAWVRFPFERKGIELSISNTSLSGRMQIKGWKSF